MSSDCAQQLRWIAEAIEDGESHPQVLVICRVRDGSLLTTDNGMTLTQTIYLAADFVRWATGQVKRFAEAISRPRCRRGTHGR